MNLDSLDRILAQIGGEGRGKNDNLHVGSVGGSVGGINLGIVRRVPHFRRLKKMRRKEGSRSFFCFQLDPVSNPPDDWPRSQISQITPRPPPPRKKSHPPSCLHTKRKRRQAFFAPFPNRKIKKNLLQTSSLCCITRTLFLCAPAFFVVDDDGGKKS